MSTVLKEENREIYLLQELKQQYDRFKNPTSQTKLVKSPQLYVEAPAPEPGGDQGQDPYRVLDDLLQELQKQESYLEVSGSRRITSFQGSHATTPVPRRQAGPRQINGIPLIGLQNWTGSRCWFNSLIQSIINNKLLLMYIYRSRRENIHGDTLVHNLIQLLNERKQLSENRVGDRHVGGPILKKLYTSIIFRVDIYSPGEVRVERIDDSQWQDQAGITEPINTTVCDILWDSRFRNGDILTTQKIPTGILSNIKELFFCKECKSYYQSSSIPENSPILPFIRMIPYGNKTDDRRISTILNDIYGISDEVIVEDNLFSERLDKPEAVMPEFRCLDTSCRCNNYGGTNVNNELFKNALLHDEGCHILKRFRMQSISPMLIIPIVRQNNEGEWFNIPFTSIEYELNTTQWARNLGDHNYMLTSVTVWTGSNRAGGFTETRGHWRLFHIDRPPDSGMVFIEYNDSIATRRSQEYWESEVKNSGQVFFYVKEDCINFNRVVLGECETKDKLDGYVREYENLCKRVVDVKLSCKRPGENVDEEVTPDRYNESFPQGLDDIIPVNVPPSVVPSAPTWEQIHDTSASPQETSPPAVASALAVASAPPALAPASVVASPQLKLFFFDFDDTLVTSNAVDGYSAKSIYPTPSGSDDVKIANDLIRLKTGDGRFYTSESVIDILSQIQSDPNSLWFIVSKGRNTDKYNELLELVKQEKDIEVKPEVEEWGIPQDSNKSDIITSMVMKMRDKYKPKNLKVMFIDDDETNFVGFPTKQQNFKPILVNSTIYTMDNFVPSWFKSLDAREKRDILQNTSTQEQREQKIMQAWTEWRKNLCPKVIRSDEQAKIVKYL